MAPWTLALCAALLLGSTLDRTPVTIFLAGDSTMARKQPDKKPETGWGEYLEGQFDAARVRVDNRAQNGRSTRTFLDGGLWAGVIAGVRPGDYVFIQFGHNDQPKEKIGSRTTPEEFRANLTRFVTDVRSKSAHPVLFTPIVRRRFDEAGRFFDTHFDYPDIVRGVARDLSVPLIDHQRMSERVLVDMGPERSRLLFLQLKPGEHPNYPKGVEDNTHFSPQGAETMARLAVEGIRGLKLGLADALLPAQRSVTGGGGRTAGRGLIGVVGAWTTHADGSWSVDGAAWSGKTGPDEVRSTIATLFASPSDTFIANATAPGAFPLAVWRDAPAFSNGTLRTQFRLIAGATDQTAGIVFGLNPAGEYFYLRYNTRDGNVAVWAFANGERRLIHHGEEKVQLPIGAWHDLAVTIDGRRVSGVAGGKVHVAHTLDTAPVGRVGVWTKRDSVTAFRSFAVSAR